MAQQKQRKVGYVSIRCKDCAHYTKSAHPLYESPCAELGIQQSSPAPVCFVPDVGRIRQHGTNITEALSVITRSLPDAQLRVLASILLTAGKVQKLGFAPFQTVYFHLKNDKYLSNFYRGQIIGVSGANSIMIMGTQRPNSPAVTAHLEPASLLTEADWSKKRESLIKQGRIQDPDGVRRRMPTRTIVNYTPPFLDTKEQDLADAAAVKASTSNKKPVRKKDNSRFGEARLVVL